MKKKNTHNDLGFKVPQGYFKANIDRLCDNVKPAQEREDSQFSVPSGYFDGLEDRIMNAVRSDQDADAVNANGFEVPKGYFDGLEDRVMNTVAQSERSANDKELPFTTPDNYFEQLEKRVLEATVDKPVVKLERDYPSWVIPMIAVAAIFVAALAIDGFWPQNALTIQDLENEEIALYLAETDFISDRDAINILYSDTDILDTANFETSISNDELLNYLADEVDMNQMLEE
ncbi:hypothetical protein [Nonlabens agnitus]|uniref:Uncharacterized protein n=1 Tax=Nonlabens agnitus TaxID=870484 RepID=A0A2S9WR50_9FLAO|nr:hypothetical protein [Nonlabens agnitus]PRP65967.1 hypothetical protein BST86_02125 [Nonlabens agnitus]